MATIRQSPTLLLWTHQLQYMCCYERCVGSMTITCADEQVYGTPSGIRTPNTLILSQVSLPIGLMVHGRWDLYCMLYGRVLSLITCSRLPSKWYSWGELNSSLRGWKPRVLSVRLQEHIRYLYCGGLPASARSRYYLMSLSASYLATKVIVPLSTTYRVLLPQAFIWCAWWDSNPHDLKVKGFSYHTMLP